MDIAHDAVLSIFDSVPMAHCAPKVLFRYERRQAWVCISTNFIILERLLELSGGLIPRQNSMHQSIRKWLDSHHLAWSLADSETAILGLRRMCQKLLRTARSGQPQAPRKFRDLDRLIQMMHVAPATRVAAADSVSECSVSSQESWAYVAQDQPPIAQQTPIECVQVGSDADSSDDVVAIVPQGGSCLDDDLASLEVGLFKTPRKRIYGKTSPGASTPEKASASGSVLDAEMESLLQAAVLTTTKPPMPIEYRQMTAETKAKMQKKSKGQSTKKAN